MREIKFRVWDKKEKVMSLGNILNIFFTPYTCQFGFMKDEKMHVVVRCIEDVELLQYTGLKDKNGKEIYEGDICRYEDRAGSVVFDKGSFSLHTNLGKGAVGCLDIGIFRNACEIIGNIYENPELLEVI